MTLADPTGHRYTLTSSRARAEVCQVGGALRSLNIDGVDLVPRYPDGIPTPAASGIVLVPWPNRIRDGKWTQGGQTRQLAITEPAFSNASHGLLRFAPYDVASLEADAVTLRAVIYPQTGYPFQLETRVTYRLVQNGLHVSHTVTNIGAQPAPVALGTHPYVCIGDVATADLTIDVAAAERFELDARKLPTGVAPVDAAHDLRSPRRVGDLSIDTAFGAIERDHNGRISGTLRAPDGRTLSVWAGEDFEYLQVFTTDRYPGHELAVAIEPMSAPADAFNSGQSLRWLSPLESWELEWGIEYTTPDHDA
ncbi:aldose 1-epimerase [Microbacterium endophyticum]|uniref:Aldose 1-epimerase n=1 Tax=Microbacterium endophyticum TaxID=1526412 RepID=A0A7W4YPT3_9MICO|nr:aldose 1-epimerase family protein [Microbacterium endophyticum]MBB2977081.1 aldose 1-epimerase [Microbacterium endophyticum]NIK36125.1 aldose 1-epimerase [Microbacterium endophyticum]